MEFERRPQRSRLAAQLGEQPGDLVRAEDRCVPLRDLAAAIAVDRRIRREDGANIEVYGTGRYIAVTGRPYRNAPNTLADLSGVVASVL